MTYEETALLILAVALLLPILVCIAARLSRRFARLTYRVVTVLMASGLLANRKRKG